MARGNNPDIAQKYHLREDCECKYSVKCKTCGKVSTTNWLRKLPEHCSEGADHILDYSTLRLTERRPTDDTANLSVFWFHTPTDAVLKKYMHLYEEDRIKIEDADDIFLDHVDDIENYQIRQKDETFAPLAWKGATPDARRKLFNNIKPKHRLEIAKAILNSGVLTEDEAKN